MHAETWGNNPLGSTERPFSCWHHIEPLYLQAPEKLEGSEPRATILKSLAPWDFSLYHCLSSHHSPSQSCSAPPRDQQVHTLPPVFPAHGANTRYKLDSETRYHHKYDNFIKIYIEYKLMIMWIKFTVCKQIY